ncbi:hypothetical protein D3C85_847800 [compost metagenome]
MLAITAQTGDIAVRTDLNKSFILKGANPTLLSDWQELLTPTDSVTNVYGRNGSITAQTGDYTADQINETTTRKFQSANQKTFNDATSSIQTQLNGKQAAGSYEPAFTKNTAFNKNFGTTTGTVTQGNDSRLSDSRTASDVYAWAKTTLKPTYSKSEVGLGNVDNIADINKSVSYAATAGSATGTPQIGTYGTGNTDITALVPGSTTGTWIKGITNAHVVVTIDGNDSDDSFNILANSDITTSSAPMTTNIFALKRTGALTMVGTITAPTFIGALSGNSTTATSLQTARTIAISGGATGTATSFNGSSNITIPITSINASNLSTGTVPDARISGSYTGMVNLTGSGTVNFAKFLGLATDTVSTPSFSWTGDLTTGFYRPTASQIGVTIAGVQRGLFSSTGLTVTGSATATNFSGPGTGLTGTATGLTAGDSSKLNGVVSSETNLASTIAKRNSSGDLQVRLLRSEYADQATISGGMVFRVNNTTDNYNRVCNDTAAIRTYLGLGTNATSSTNYLPIAGGIMSGNIGRAAHNSGFLEGSYNSVGANSTNTNPIYTIGSAYNPNSTDLGNMYGLGYCSGSASFINSTDLGATPTGWGQYVAADGNARIFLEAASGNIYGLGNVYASQGVFRSAITGASLTVTGDVTAFSDARVKENIRPIANVIDRIQKSRGIVYDRIDTKQKNNIGFIAQELEENFPELVLTREDGTKAVKYQNAVAVLFEAIKEQQIQIDNLIQKLNN